MDTFTIICSVLVVLGLGVWLTFEIVNLVKVIKARKNRAVDKNSDKEVNK